MSGAQDQRDAGAVDRDVPDVSESATTAMGQWSMKETDPVAELVKFEAAAELMRKLVPASIKATRSQDWVKMGDKVYLQGTGVERIAALWGLIFGEPRIERNDLDHGDYEFVVSGPIASRRTGVGYARLYGGRSSADPFFAQYDEDKPKGFADLPGDEKRRWKLEHRVPPDPLDVRKAAVTNWMTRGASMLSGLRGLTLEDLTAEGLRGVREVTFGSGGKGGDATPSDVKNEQTKLGNEVLRRVGGDKEAARQLLVDITSQEATDKKKAFAGHKTVATMKQDWQFKPAWAKLQEHPVFGDNPEGQEPEENSGKS